MKVNPGNCRKIASFFIGVAKICYMVSPVGDCEYCCTRKDEIDIRYELYTRSNPKAFQLIATGDLASLGRTNFNASHPTVIYLMGFSESTDGPSTTLIRDSHLASGDYNFIAVDWARLIVFPWYATAVRNTRYMGRRLADLIMFLGSSGVPASRVHVIGFSLGAEAAGFAGKDLRARGVLIGRITGLDPAYPGYALTNSEGHLAKGDATFVDVIHTNPGIFGFPEALGDVDFYPNPGFWVQPGCWIDQLFANKEIRFIYGCSHVRAWRLYSETLSNPLGFPATLCRDWTSASSKCQFQTHGYMGLRAPMSLKGKMYLLTKEKPPFARNGP